MGVRRRILAMGGHDFDRRPGNQALCDKVVELTGKARPRVCLVPTAGGDPEEQIGRFRRNFGERGAVTSEISLFRLGNKPVELRSHLLSQDVIYVSGGSMLNLIAIWRAHALDAIMREAYEAGVAIAGQSAGAMCWFEAGVTKSSGAPQACSGLGVLKGSASVHYHSEPERGWYYREEVARGSLTSGYGLDDQAGVLFEEGEMRAAYSARDGAGVWRVFAEGGVVEEIPVDAVGLSDAKPPIGDVPPDVIELRRVLEAQSALRRGRGRTGSGPGRL